MKRTISLLLALLLIAGTAGTVPFIASAGGGEPVFPDEPIYDSLTVGTDLYYSFDAYAYAWIEFQAPETAFYLMESYGEADIDAEVYNADGYLISADTDSGGHYNFCVYAYAEKGKKIYLKAKNYDSTSAAGVIRIRRSNIESIKVIEEPDKKEYTYMIDNFVEISGLKYRLTYTDGSTAEWYQGVSLGPLDDYAYFHSYFIYGSHSMLGQNLSEAVTGVMLMFAGMKDFYNITVNEFPYKSFTIDSMPYRNNYVVGVDYSADLNGMEITLDRYDGGQEHYSFNPYSDNFFPYEYQIGTEMNSSGYWETHFTPGTNTIYLTIFLFTRSFTRNAVENTFDRIEIIRTPDKKEYYENQIPSLSLKGGIMRVYRKNGTYEDINLYDNMESVNGREFRAYFKLYPISQGNNEIGVSYAGMDTVFSVTGIKSPVRKLEVTKLPKRLKYYEPEWGVMNIDSEGIELKITFNDNSVLYYPKDSDKLDTGSLLFYFDAPTVPDSDDNAIVVEYLGARTTYKVDITECRFVGAYVSKYPVKDKYFDGQVCTDFDPSGLEIVLYRRDSTYIVWNYDTYGGKYDGIPVKFSCENFRLDFNPVYFEVGGYQTYISLKVIPFEVEEISVVNGPRKDGTGFTGSGTLKSGETFTFSGSLFQEELAEEFYAGTFEVNKNMHFAFTCESYPSGVMISAFGKSLSASYREGGMMGDMDGDGSITVADALAALRIAAKLVAETSDALATGDVDSDGSITVADALAILRVAAKLTDHF